MHKKREEFVEQLSNIIQVEKNTLLVSFSDRGEWVANRLAGKLGLAYERFFTQSVYCEQNLECELAVVDEFQNSKINLELVKSFEIDIQTLDNSIEIMYFHKLLPNLEKIRGDNISFRVPTNISNILIVDEVIETGYKMELVIESLKKFHLPISIALIVLPTDYVDMFKRNVKNLFFVKNKEFYAGLESFYLEENKIQNEG